MRNLHIQHARLAKIPNIFVDGKITITGDLRDNFEHFKHEELCLSMSPQGDFSVRIDKSKRETETGFLTSELYGDLGLFRKDGLKISFPKIFSDNIRSAMQWHENSDHKIAVTTNHHSSMALHRNETSEITYRSKTCYLELSQEKGAIKVYFSSDVDLATRVPGILENENDHEKTHSSVNRVECTFLIDYVSRSLRYGIAGDDAAFNQLTYHNRSDQEEVLEDVPVPNLDQIVDNNISLKNAYLSKQPSIFYGIQDGCWIAIDNHDNQIIDIFALKQIKKDNTGFIVTSSRMQAPSLKFHIGGMEELINKVNLRAYKGKREHSEKKLVFDGPVGNWQPTAMQNREIFESRNPIDCMIYRLELHLLLNKIGFFFTYRAYCPTYQPVYRGKPAENGWLEGTICIPCSSLVVRHPEFWLTNRSDWNDGKCV